jgi:ribonuclease HII
LRGLDRGDVLTDSKKLDGPARERLCAAILTATPHVGWAAVGPASIDSMNILEASREAMRLALLELPTLPDVSLVDGLPVPHMPCPHEAIVGGDRIELVIAAASIVAKVTRDRMMTMYDELYPGYAFASHKGYYAPAHIAALAELGPCPIHRYSFAPVRDARDACFPGPSPGRKRHERPIEPAPPGAAWPRGGDPGDEFPDPVGV